MWILLVLSSSHGSIYLFTMIDRTTRWPEVLGPPSQLSLVLVLSSLPGFQDLEFLQFSRWTEVLSSRLLSGLEFVLC